ncbi:MAG: histidine phosphatase family protein [Propionibacteriaceae bacterium]|nr:histidine phosphatase family protein [Propionibacteriaceae bacterium]
MRIIFIRHGRTASNTQHALDTGFPGAPLDEVGQEQAQALVDRLKDEPIEAVYTSDILRARQTGTPLAEAKDVPLTTNAGLREVYAGDWDMDVEWEDFINVTIEWEHDLTASMPGGDSGESFFARYTKAVNEIAATGHECVAIVSHGAAMRVWLPWAAGLHVDDEAYWVLHNTDIVTLEGTPGAWKALTWGSRVL